MEKLRPQRIEIWMASSAEQKMWGNPAPSDYPNAEVPNFNMGTFVLFSVFIILLLAYLIILPGVRKKGIVATIVYVMMLFVGASIIGAIYFPRWAGGSQRIYTQFRAHSNERILAQIGVDIGLQKVNVTLRFERLISSNDLLPEVDMTKLYYNEGFDISGVSSMSEALHHALSQGLPYPMLSVLEYFSLNQDAFDWGRHYRVAGHYTHAVMWFAFACWLLTAVLILLLPHDAYKSLLATGCSLLVANLLYLTMSPCELRIAFTGENLERVDLTVTFSFCFYLIFANGLLCIIAGLGLGLCQHWRYYVLTTFFEAELDDDVGPKKYRKLDNKSPTLLAVRHVAQPRQNRGRDVEEMTINTMAAKGSHKGELSIDNKTQSSGFQSQCHSSASSASLKSEASFDTVHDETELEESSKFAVDQPCCSSSS